jgi:amidohydrolase
MGEILKGITLAYGGSYELDYNRGTPATINNPALTTQVVPSLERAIGKENVMAIPPTMGGEDFSFFSNIVPGFYYRLGMVKPGTVSGGHHTPTFRADDSCISVGMEAMSTLIVDFMKAGGLK